MATTRATPKAEQKIDVLTNDGRWLRAVAKGISDMTDVPEIGGLVLFWDSPGFGWGACALDGTHWRWPLQ